MCEGGKSFHDRRAEERPPGQQREMRARVQAKLQSGKSVRRQPDIRQCQAARTFRCSFYEYFFNLPQFLLAEKAIKR
jgi:hypothetical protein